MIEITRPDGSVIAMNEAQFAQFYYADHRLSSSGTRIDGPRLQFTPERAEALATRLAGRLRLVVLTIPPDGARPAFPIWINAAAISALQAKGSGTSLIVTRAWFTVTEDIDTVRHMIGQGAQPARAAKRASRTPASNLFADPSAELTFDDPRTIAPPAEGVQAGRKPAKTRGSKKPASKKPASKAAASKKKNEKDAAKKRASKSRTSKTRTARKPGASKAKRGKAKRKSGRG